MKPSVVIVTIIAFVIAVFSGMSVIKMGKTPPPVSTVAAAPPPIKTRFVLTASNHIDVGTHLTSDSFKWVEWPEDLSSKLNGPISVRTLAEEKSVESVFRNSVVKSTLERGDFITPVKLFKQGVNNGSIISYILKSGNKAVTLPLDALNGASGLLQPGDRIDIYLTQVLNDPYAGRIVPTTGQMMPKFDSQTILKDIKVLAIDKQLSASKGNGKEERLGRTTTVELTSDQVSIVNIAERMGSLTYVIRSVSNDGVDESITKPYALTDLMVVPGVTAARLGTTPDKLDLQSNPFKIIDAKGQPKTVDLYRGSEANKQSVQLVNGKLDMNTDNGMVVIRGPKSVSRIDTPDPNAKLSNGSDTPINTQGALTDQQRANGIGGSIGNALNGVSNGLSGGFQQNNDVPYVPYVSPSYLNSITKH